MLNISKTSARHPAVHPTLPKHYSSHVMDTTGKEKRTSAVGGQPSNVVDTAPLSLTFPIPFNYILQRPQYRMETVLKKRSARKGEVAQTVCAAARRERRKRDGRKK